MDQYHESDRGRCGRSGDGASSHRQHPRYVRGRRHVVAAHPHLGEDLGGKNNVLAGGTEILEGLLEHFFAFSLGIDIGGVEEFNAGVEARLDQFVGSRLIDGANDLETARASMKGHGAEAEG